MSNIRLTVDGSYSNAAQKPSRLGIGITIDTSEYRKKIALSWITDSTSMQAEYEALICGLVLILGTDKKRDLEIYMDALVVVNHITGKYQVHSPELIPYYRRAMRLLNQFTYTITHIPRKNNAVCDRLSKLIK